MQQAFTLIELIIYLAIFTFLTLLSFSFLSHIQKSVFINSSKSEKNIRLQLAADLLRRDLMSASCNKYDWNTNDFVFKKVFLDQNGIENETCICWKIDKKGLTRIYGEYSFAANKWIKRTMSRVFYGKIKFNFYVKEDFDGSFFKCVEFDFGDNEKNIICLRNGLFI